jgi:hypothetical protein
MSNFRKVIRRRTFPIRAYIGPNGGGKTLAAVEDLLPTLLGSTWSCDPKFSGHQHQESQGERLVYSTTPILDSSGLLHPLYRPIRDFREMVGLSHCDVLLDEVNGVASSRSSQSLPPSIEQLLVQLRRRDVTCSWTAPAWARADTILREVTQVVTQCQGFFGGSGSSWSAKKLFRFRTYDTAQFDSWTTHKRETLRPLVSQWYVRSRHSAHTTYNTLGAVDSVSWPDPAGMCITCGGHRARPSCLCDDYLERKHAVRRPRTSTSGDPFPSYFSEEGLPTQGRSLWNVPET